MIWTINAWFHAIDGAFNPSAALLTATVFIYYTSAKIKVNPLFAEFNLKKHKIYLNFHNLSTRIDGIFPYYRKCPIYHAYSK